MYVERNTEALWYLCTLYRSEMVVPFDPARSHFLLMFTVLHMSQNDVTVTNFSYYICSQTLLFIQGGSNMTGTDLCVNKPHWAAAVRPWESEATTSTLPPARVRTCSFRLGVARVMSEQKVPRSVEQRILIKFLVGENVPSAEIHHRLQQQYGEEVSPTETLFPILLLDTCSYPGTQLTLRLPA